MRSRYLYLAGVFLLASLVLTCGRRATERAEGRPRVPTTGAAPAAANTGNPTVTEADIGAPFYPGSQEQPYGSMRMSDGLTDSWITKRTTIDSMDQIQQFYMTRISSMKKIDTPMNRDNIRILTFLGTNGGKGQVTMMKVPGKDQVTITLTNAIIRSASTATSS